MNYLKITIITVCYNAAETIGNALRSVKEQSYPNIEHIFVDGASTDGTQAIISLGMRQQDKLISEPDTGVYNAMNKGISAASGDIIGFLNADDYYANNNVVENIIVAFSKEPNINAIFGDIAFFHLENPKKLYRHYNSWIFRPWMLRWGWMPAHPGMFITQSVYKQLGGYKEDYKIAGDYELVARGFANKLFNYRHLKEVLVHMRPGGISTKNFSARLLINREAVRACLSNGIYSNKFMIMAKYPIKLLGYL
jgi:glycosyltransferase involved in cell wall biosynthesis